METLEAGPGRAVITARAREGFTRRRLHCDWATGLAAGTPILFGLPPGNVVESECQARGDERCLYTLTWDAELAAEAADPQQRVTALEGQLRAMSERLHNVYAIASDLVSTDDLDTVLNRIVERAASAVRAPGLHPRRAHRARTPSFRSTAAGSRHARRGEFAEAALEDDAPDSDSALIAEVTSSRRHYGRLIARYPASGQVPAPGTGDARPVRKARSRRARHRDRAAGVRAAQRPGELPAVARARRGPGGDERARSASASRRRCPKSSTATESPCGCGTRTTNA